MAIYAHKDQEKPGKTAVSYNAGLLTDDIPTMPDATSLRLTDGDLFELRFETTAAFEPVIDFYKKELPALGWKYREGAGLFQKEHTFFFFDGDNKHHLSVDLKPAAGGKTMASFAHISPEIEAAYERKSKVPPKTAPALLRPALSPTPPSRRSSRNSKGTCIATNKAPASRFLPSNWGCRMHACRSEDDRGAKILAVVDALSNGRHERRIEGIVGHQNTRQFGSRR